MKEKLAALLEVRKITMLLFVALFIVLALKGTMDMDKVYSAILMVLSFYFGKSTALVNQIRVNSCKFAMVQPRQI